MARSETTCIIAGNWKMTQGLRTCTRRTWGCRDSNAARTSAKVITLTGAEELELYGVVSSGTATVSYLFPS